MLYFPKHAKQLFLPFQTKQLFLPNHDKTDKFTPNQHFDSNEEYILYLEELCKMRKTIIFEQTVNIKQLVFASKKIIKTFEKLVKCAEKEQKIVEKMSNKH